MPLGRPFVRADPGLFVCAPRDWRSASRVATHELAKPNNRAGALMLTLQFIWAGVMQLTRCYSGAAPCQPHLVVVDPLVTGRSISKSLTVN